FLEIFSEFFRFFFLKIHQKFTKKNTTTTTSPLTIRFLLPSSSTTSSLLPLYSPPDNPPAYEDIIGAFPFEPRRLPNYEEATRVGMVIERGTPLSAMYYGTYGISHHIIA